MKEKLNLQYGDLVKIKNMNPELDGTIVRVCGVSMRNLWDVYIVEFLEDATRTAPDGEEYSAFVVPEGYLERVSYEDWVSWSNRHSAKIIAIYDGGLRAAVKFANGHIECVTKRGMASEFVIGMKGTANYARCLNGCEWTFEPSLSNS